MLLIDKGMTEQEVIKVIRNKACNDRCTEIHCDDSCMYGENKCAFHMAIKALEKQIPMKPIKNNPIKNEVWIESAMLCPVCNGYVNKFGNKYCSKCGQKLDWE